MRKKIAEKITKGKLKSRQRRKEKKRNQRILKETSALYSQMLEALKPTNKIYVDNTGITYVVSD